MSKHFFFSTKKSLETNHSAKMKNDIRNSREGKNASFEDEFSSGIGGGGGGGGASVVEDVTGQQHPVGHPLQTITVPQGHIT